MWKQHLVLVDNSNAPPFRFLAGDVFAIDRDAAFHYWIKARQGFEQHRLAGAGGTQDYEVLPILYLQVYVLQHEGTEIDLQSPYLDHAFRPLKASILSTTKATSETRMTSIATGAAEDRP